MGTRTVAERIEERILGVSTGRLNEAVRRNAHRFPADFVFRLTAAEAADLISQIAISSPAHGGRRHLPYAFTEHGVAMLSSVLHSERAIAVNILIVRAFVRLRRLLSEGAELQARVREIEQVVDVHSVLLTDILAALKALEQPDPQPRRHIGFGPGTS